MTCEEALPLLSAYLDGEAAPEEAAALQAHLARCAACREVLAAYREIDRGVALLEEEAPPALHAAVMARVGRPHARRRTWAAAAAAAAVLAVVIAAGGLPGLDRGSAAVAESSAASARALKEAPEEEAALVVELTDDPSAPAAEHLADLRELTACVQGDRVEYWTDAATAREIVEACEDRYQTAAPEALAQADGGAPCAIRIVQP